MSCDSCPGGVCKWPNCSECDEEHATCEAFGNPVCRDCDIDLHWQHMTCSSCGGFRLSDIGKAFMPDAKLCVCEDPRPPSLREVKQAN